MLINSKTKYFAVYTKEEVLEFEKVDTIEIGEEGISLYRTDEEGKQLQLENKDNFVGIGHNEGSSIHIHNLGESEGTISD